MINQKELVLFDIDHTLFDTRRYLTLCFEALAKHLEVTNLSKFLTLAFEQYRIQRKSGTFHPQKFLSAVLIATGNRTPAKELEQIFKDKNIIKNSLYPDVEDVLKQLSDRGIILGIFSHGEQSLQKNKIAGLSEVFEEKYIHINDVDKLKEIPSVLKRNRDKKIYIIDDLPGVLRSFKEQNSYVTTILIDRRGLYKEKSLQDIFYLDYTIANLQEMLTILQ